MSNDFNLIAGQNVAMRLPSNVTGYNRDVGGLTQGCGSGFFSIASASSSTPIASASTIKKRENDC